MWTREQLEKLHEQVLTRDARDLNLKMSADPIGRNRPQATSRPELKLPAADWKYLIANRFEKEEGAILRFVASQAGITPPEKKSGAPSTPAATRPASSRSEAKKRLILLEARLMGARKFTGGSSEQIRALQNEVDLLKAEAATV